MGLQGTLRCDKHCVYSPLLVASEHPGTTASWPISAYGHRQLLAECRRSPGTASSEYLEIKNRVDAYQNLRKTYLGGNDLSFANARKTVNFAILDSDIY